MSASQTPLKDNDYITPPESFIEPPLTPPPTDEKPYTQAARVIALFNEIKAGSYIRETPWLVFQLQRGEFDEIEHLLEQDQSLWGFVQDKIR